MNNEHDGFEFIERRILIGLIMKRNYLEQMQPLAADLERLLETKWTRLVCGWVLDYYERRNRQPKWSNIEAVYERQKADLDPDTQDLIWDLLKGLGNEHSKMCREGQSINVEELLLDTKEYLRCRHNEAHAKDVAELMERNETEKVEQLWQNYSPLTFDEDPDFIWSNQVKSELQTWLWGGGKLSGYRIPLGETTMFAGDLEKGKSTCALDIVARVSKGDYWPITGEGKAPQGDVLIISGEDKYKKTIKPRLEAAGADHSHIAFFKVIVERRDKRTGQPIYRTWTVHDMARLRRVLDKMPNPVLMLIDPLSAFLGGREIMDANQTSDIRNALYPLDNLMEERDMALLVILHLNKNQQQLAIHRISGSGALAQMPRSGFLFGEDKYQPGRIVMARLKGNLTWDKTGMAFRIRSKDVIHDDGKEGSLPVIEWEDEAVDTDKDDLLSGKKDDSKVGEAVEFLSQQFADVAFADLRAKEMEDKATERGVKLNTLYRARLQLNVKTVKRGGRGGHFVWQWPTLNIEKFLRSGYHSLNEIVEYAECNSPSGAIMDRKQIRLLLHSYLDSLPKLLTRTDDEKRMFYSLPERSNTSKIIAFDAKRMKRTRKGAI